MRRLISYTAWKKMRSSLPRRHRRLRRPRERVECQLAASGAGAVHIETRLGTLVTGALHWAIPLRGQTQCITQLSLMRADVLGS